MAIFPQRVLRTTSGGCSLSCDVKGIMRWFLSIFIKLTQKKLVIADDNVEIYKNWMPSIKPYPFRNSKLKTHEEGRARGRPCEYRQTKPLRSLSQDSILLFPLARHIHILQWELLLAEQCTLTIYLSQQPHDCLPRRALEISSSLRLHKIARGIFRMKAIRGWRILKLFMSLFLKERIALKYWHLEQSMRICLILSRILPSSNLDNLFFLLFFF